MTDRQLMQQALDALNSPNFGVHSRAILALQERLAHCDRCGKKLGGEGDIHTCTPDPIGDAQDRLIAELAAQPEQEPFSPEAISATQRAWQMGYEAAKAEMQTEQKPVAQLGDGVFWCDTCRSVQEAVHHSDPNERDVWCKGDVKWLQGPFYTTPPAAPMTEFEEAVAAVDNTLHHAIDHWQDRALKAEALLAQPEQEPVAWMTINAYGEEDDIHYENPEGHLLEGWTYRPLYTHPLSVQPQPVSMRMPKAGDKVICLEDESLATVVSLTAGGSPDIVFSDGSRGTYLLHEFAELFGYATPPAAAPVQHVKWEDAAQAAHPKSDPQYWPESLKVRFMEKEILQLRATPPAAQRQWVGLTVPEMEELTLLVGRMDYTRMLQLAEAKLKERNT